MRRPSLTLTPSRRDFLLTTAGLAASISLGDVIRPVLAATTSKDFDAALQALTKGATPIAEKISLEIDPYVEHGSMVFYRLSVDHPMMPDDFVERVHILSTENPLAHIASFHFTPQSGRAALAGRMRLAKTQTVVSLAELTGGRLYIAKRHVQVAIGGCES